MVPSIFLTKYNKNTIHYQKRFQHEYFSKFPFLSTGCSKSSRHFQPWCHPPNRMASSAAEEPAQDVRGEQERHDRGPPQGSEEEQDGGRAPGGRLPHQ